MDDAKDSVLGTGQADVTDLPLDEKLRATQELLGSLASHLKAANGDRGTAVAIHVASQTCGEAADEIERLRDAAIKWHWDDCEQSGCDLCVLVHPHAMAREAE